MRAPTWGFNAYCVFYPSRSEEESPENLVFWRGLKPCARCAGKSMAKIGNRKERLRDYARFQEFGGQRPQGGNSCFW